MISPENNEPLRRRGHNSNVIGESSSIATNNSPQHTMMQSRDKSGGVGTSTERQPITTLIRERQMGVVSPDNNNIDKGGDGGIDNKTMSISKSITVSNLMVVTPISSSTDARKSKLNPYETPQK